MSRASFTVGASLTLDGESAIPADLTLETHDEFSPFSTVLCHSQIVALSSPVLAVAISLLELNAMKTLQVEGDHHAWTKLLDRLYPCCNNDTWSLEEAKQILPLVHRYDIHLLLDSILRFLLPILPKSLSTHSSSPGFVLSWLKIADSLQIDEVKAICLAFIQNAAYEQKIERMIFCSIPDLTVKLVKNQPKTPCPTTCPRFSHSGSRTCSIEWCERCSSWGCVALGCRDCGSPLAPVKPSKKIGRVFLGDDLPRLTDEVKSLSTSLLQELLAALVITQTHGYVNNQAL